jgi:hypothetical protein
MIEFIMFLLNFTILITSNMKTIMKSLAHQNRHLFCLILYGLLIGGSPAFAYDISGTYVGKGDNIAVLIQIVQTNDGQLTGRYEQVVLKSNGKLDDMNATLTGATNGQTVVVTIKPSEFLAGSFAASGTIEGNLLHLTGGYGGDMNLNLLKSDEADFRSQIATLTNQANRINETRTRQEAVQRQAKIEAEQLANLQDLTQRMVAFISKADVQLDKFFKPIEQSYRTITQNMRAALAREKTIQGSGQAAVARSQISVDINQAAIKANQVHIQAQSAYEDFDFNSGQLHQDSQDAHQGCWAVHAGPSTPSTYPAPPGRETWNMACMNFLDTDKKFEQRVTELRVAFIETEKVWTIERYHQDMILQASSDVAQYGKVIHGWLGIMFQNLTPKSAKFFNVAVTKGVIISDVVSGSPAEKGNLKRGDIIKSFNGKQVEDFMMFKRFIATTKPQTPVTIEIVREGKPVTVKLMIGIYSQ